MEIATPAERVLTQTDHLRLTRLLARSGAVPGFETIRDLLDTSDLVEPGELPPTVITMDTRLLLESATGSEPLQLTVCYPEAADAARGRVSVLSPVGLALLGRRAGEAISWRLPAGDERCARILAILYQPEAHAEHAT
jgi:regulator of nucleoside diphosphate kinase